MGRVAYLDAFAGISGDMTVAALVDAGAPWDVVRAGLVALGIPGWHARMERVHRGPFAAAHFVVELDAVGAGGGGGPEHDHDHGHGRGHGHGYAHEHEREPGLVRSAGPSRAWRDIRARIDAAPLPARARRRALAAFARLAEAEGRVHGIPPDDVTFHEVGAVDSIVDIVGACLALDLLDVDRIVASALPLGSGHVRGEHGWIPLPAPATLEVLRGWPVVDAGRRGETVTPTGAALVAALAEPGPLPAMRVHAIGVGAGTRDDPEVPNVLRVLVGEGAAGGETDVVELRAQVDGLPGEEVPPLVEALLAAGALDAWVTPIAMKKGRPGLLVGALARPGDRAIVGDALLRHGRTLGYRWSPAAREVLDRAFQTVDTPWGAVRVKLGRRGEEVWHAQPEHDDCAAVARAAGVSVAAVHGAALAALGTGRRT